MRHAIGFVCLVLAACIPDHINSKKTTVEPASPPPPAATAEAAPVKESAPAVAEAPAKPVQTPFKKLKAFPIKLAGVEPHALQGTKGDCFIAVVTVSSGSVAAPVANGEDVGFNIKEPAGTYGGKVLLASDEVDHNKGVCLLDSGPVRIPADKVVLGSGSGTLEVWQRRMDDDEWNALGRKRVAQSVRADQYDADKRATTCSACRAQLRSCVRGDTHPSSSSTCGKDYYSCADKAQSFHGTNCG
jgi:hypothetical protein